jgi:glutamine amidotransferase PdxT
MFTSYFEASHAEYLQASGARTVHIDYTMPIDDLRKELAQLNGLYIPGDAHTTLNDLAFRHTVAQLLEWAQVHNKKQSMHFPVLATSWGYLNMIRSQMRVDEEMIEMEGDTVCKQL